MEAIRKGEVKVCDGNLSAAHAVMLARPDVIAIYPITPQTSLIEKISKFKAEGLIDAEILEVEGEISAMGSVVGACAAGGRVFTSSSSMGLNFMFDTYMMAATFRLPVVMVNANRENPAPATVSASEQDIMSVIEAGWIHIHVENCQEILDSILMAYKLAEDPEILLPVSVCYDGFYLSYLQEPVEIPPQPMVDSFLERRSRPHLGFDPPRYISWRPVSDEEPAEYRYRQQVAYQKAKEKIGQIDEDFGHLFGRSYGGLIEAYRMEDAEIALVSLGSHTGTARVVVDKKRDEGIKVGLVKVRAFRPFPNERLAASLKGLKAIGVIDRSVCYGWMGGHLYRELKTALYGLNIPIADFIGGLAGHDITIPLIEKAVDVTLSASEGKPYEEVTWLALEE
jgi:pyruvate/2-oxoacid:ferredoxin oxidoreductase alpha subunit